MTAKEEYILSIYEELCNVGTHDNVKLVKSSLDGMLYIKKVLTNYNTDIYQQLKKKKVKGIPTIYEIIEVDEELIVIEDYIHGKSLSDISNGKMPIEEAKKIILSLCDILKELHQMNPPIVHRDIKPENIVITNEGTVYLIDFNISRQFVDNKSKDTMIMGTSGYAAPEQFGFAQTDARTDIYSMGMLMKNITGISENSQYKDEIQWNKIVSKCIQMDPRARYQSIEEFQKAINGSGGSNTDKNVDKSYALPGFRSGKTYRKVIAVFGYLCVILFAGILEVENGSVIDMWFVKIAFVVGCFSFIAVVCNWMNILGELPQFVSHNIILKVILGVMAGFFSICVTSLLAIFVESF